MRIVIDMQGAQSKSDLCPIDRYALLFAQAIVRNRDEHEIILALNGLFAETIEPIRAAFAGLLPQKNIRLWSAPGPVDYLTAPKWRRDIAEHIREYFIAHMKPDVVLVTGLFAGFDQDSVTSIGKTFHRIPTAALISSLIPSFQRKPDLENSVIDDFYLNRLDHLRRTDLILSTSEWLRQDAIQYLGFAERSVVNIAGGADARFLPRYVSPSRESELRHHYSLQRAFVIYTGLTEHRNVEALVRAYARLPSDIGRQHQLAILCTASVPEGERRRLIDLAVQSGLLTDDLIIAGLVPEDDLIDLYNLCAVFVLPSWDDGIGLPALDAMACGAPVIGAGTAGLPEIIGREDALFDPHDDAAVTAILSRVLSDAVFRQTLAQHGLEQAKRFTWDVTAKRALSVLEQAHADGQKCQIAPTGSRPKLAYISPLPPQNTGISDYSTELLPQLSRYYDIEVVVAQQEVHDPYIRAAFPIRAVDWFRSHADHYDRVLYHFGNSPLHRHMFGLLREIPGVVVLHDFFLSDLIAYLEANGLLPNGRPSELYRSYGYEAVRQFFHSTDSAGVLARYPCNLSIVQHAQGIIVHSANSLRLAEQWYGNDCFDWAVIPHLRDARISWNRIAARHALGIGPSDFLVCTFGMLGAMKLNQRLLQAWLKSSLARNGTCRLIFVGEVSVDSRDLPVAIRRASAEANIRITGRVAMEVFRQYLAAADIAVQLRNFSRGETSGAVLDCMNHGLATIVNAHDSMADLDGNAVWKLPDEFTDTQLIEALETLWKNAELRKKFAANARETIVEQHNPAACAAKYHEAIERFSSAAAGEADALAARIAGLGYSLDDRERTKVSKAIAWNMRRPFKVRQLLLDVSAIAQLDLKTGIQRVVRAVMREWLVTPPAGIRVEPVYATADGVYRYARRLTLEFLKCPSDVLADDPVEFGAGDILFMLDFNRVVVEASRAFYQRLRAFGVRVYFMVYDLLPVVMPHHFTDGHPQSHRLWLEIVGESDGAFCISRAVAEELVAWIAANGPKRRQPLKIESFHLGADLQNSTPTNGLPADADRVLHMLASRPSFLMIGTLESRKGHTQVLAAFERCWQEGVEINLVLVGTQGWHVNELTEKIRSHPQLDKRLFWLEGISDEYLEGIYAASACLIAASEGEGFGLPLIEAARHKLPIIARDIPVFREVAGGHAFYFAGNAPTDLATALKEWLALYAAGEHPKSGAMPWLTWKESAEYLKEILLKDDCYAKNRSESQVCESRRALSAALIQSVPAKGPARQFLLDVSATCRNDLKTGIERVARALMLAFLERPPEGFRVEPVYLSDNGGAWHYRYARRFTLDLLDCPADAITDDPVAVQAGDVLLGLDFSGPMLVEAAATGLYSDYRNRGIAVYFAVYDLLPLRLPQYFPPGAGENHEKWLRAVLTTDGALCISQSVADDLHDWARICDTPRRRPFRIGWFHLGADIDSAAPTRGLPGDAADTLAALAARPSFLMVGTIEPRKGYLQVLDAFDRLLSEGLDVNLTIVGAEGWQGVPRDMRRTIPQILERLQSHPELERRLFWVNGPSDEYLEKIYAASSCLIAASEGEGFGLPLIEAARHGLPIIARDIPVFREVAGEHAFYFAGEEPDSLTKAIEQWLALRDEGKHPKPDGLLWITWMQSVARLKEILLQSEWYASLTSTVEQNEQRVIR